MRSAGTAQRDDSALTASPSQRRPPQRIDQTAAPNTGQTTLNWSGIAITTAATKFGASSYSSAVMEFTVPTVRQAIGVCQNENYFLNEWTGLDGWLNEKDLLQAGVIATANCVSGKTTTSYVTFLEWYPAPALSHFSVHPGDTMYIHVYASDTTHGVVYLFDETMNKSSIFMITAPSGASLIGNSAEWIMERGCCTGTNLSPLADYTNAASWADSASLVGGGTNFPGNPASSTVWINMTNDQGTQQISIPFIVGYPSPYSGTESVLITEVINCALNGGCTP
jgi:hypothetical protein